MAETPSPPKPAAIDTHRVQRATLTTQTEDALKADIIEGVFDPGRRLTTAELTDRYGVSATPLREALQRLASQGFVDIDPRLGATVAQISRAQLLDTYRVRSLLESLAVGESVKRGDDAWAERLQMLFADLEKAVAESAHREPHDVMSWSSAHRAFHEGLMAACDSPWLTRLLNVINDHSERYRMLSARTGNRDPLGEHSAILEAALARDSDSAIRALQEHLERTVAVIESTWPLLDDEPRR